MGVVTDYRLDGSIATITMDDGKVNAISPRMIAELGAAFDRAAADEAVVLLRGRDGIFSAGFDLAVLRAGGREAYAMVEGGLMLAERILAFPYPVVIACTGHALAMGVFLLLAGDHRIGADGPYKVAANEVAIGLTMPYSAIEMLRQRLTPAAFNRAVTTAEVFSPQAAAEAGFLDRVVPAADLQDAARATAEAMTRLDLRAHTASKLRARANALQAVRAGLEADRAEPLIRV